MKLQTTVPLIKFENPIDYQSKLLLLGSCFVENIGDKLKYYNFQQLQNPFGILFHPFAIENLVERAIENRNYQESEVFEQDGRWHCFDAHSANSATSKTILLQNLNESLEETKQQLEQTTHIIITLGTAWVYRDNKTKKVVANCHKVSQKEFSKELLSIEVIKNSLARLIELVHSINESAQVIFTISPVRHLKDGFMENQQSKSHLITALHGVLSSRAQSRGIYFPSYEIMMDELRDYRFYGKDMVHPNELAIDYIWEKFKSSWISSQSYTVMEEVDTIQKGLQHRAFNPDSEEHQKFKKSLQAKITYLKERYPFMKFD
ncbi:GSCFA domain-containing protein [Flagellimonas aquimarina]|uniref:GSCFA domain-containing protein n=1 Tax=Flagellimonas aquimarina TaxID=2201895 RepID=A0A316L1P2_9FLAO|nr:GSCFA domain-containing protein [Allomuricauda koreensis]PWL40437.1 GSCFA domain-containing protein [Allomuricauda koreensis]